MHELLSETDLTKLFPQVQDALLEIADYREQNNSAESMRYVLPTHWGRALEVGEPIIRYVHGRMMKEAHPRSGLPYPFTHVWRGYLSDIIDKLSDGVMTQPQRSSFAGQLARIFKYNKLAERTGTGKTKDWNIRPWPPALTIEVGGYKTISPALEAEIAAREKQVGEAPVKTSYDLTTIKAPEKWTPESLIHYVEELKSCFARLQKVHGELQKAYDEVTEERDLLQGRLAEVATDEWELAGERIKEIVMEDWREKRSNQHAT